MTTDQAGVIVYRDGAGNLYVRVPDEQRGAVERMLADQDTSGFLAAGTAAFAGVAAPGGLTPLGLISRVSDPLASHGIIIIGGRPR